MRTNTGSNASWALWNGMANAKRSLASPEPSCGSTPPHLGDVLIRSCDVRELVELGQLAALDDSLRPHQLAHGVGLINHGAPERSTLQKWQQ